MNFSRFLDIQSWWEVPSIAYFCSLFRTAFNLLDFDIEELEEALLTDGTEDSGSSLLTELIVRLLNGCLGNNDISAFNYQMYLRRLFRQKCQESSRYNPFNTDIDFQFLPLRRKVEILYALCDFRLDAEDVFDLFKNLEAESLRVEPLGWDDNDSAYWYFYGTRLYREDIIRKPKGKKKKKKERKRSWLHGDDWNDEETERVWQVVCFTEEDWTQLTQKFSKATSKVEKELYRSLSQNFMPEIPRLFQEKERLQRKRLLELAPRRTSSRVLQKLRQKEEEESSKTNTNDEASKDEESKESQDLARRNRAKRRNLLRSNSASSDTSDSSDSSDSSEAEMPQKLTKNSKNHGKKTKNHKGEPPPETPVRAGRKTNNSLASATGQIVIPDTDEPVNSTRKKLKTSQIFSQTDEDIQIDMYKVLEQLTNHEDAWPFLDPVEEEYAPNYYTVIRRPMDLHKMEERLDGGFYTDFATFKDDFKLIVNNCRLYNGQDNEYTAMVDNLQAAFDRLTEKYIYRVSSSDEEIAVEYQLPTPSRRQKRKASDSPVCHAPGKRKKQSQSHSQSEDSVSEPRSSTSDVVKQERDEHSDKNDDDENNTSVDKSQFHRTKKSKESHKDKSKKKRKGHHHRHGKHSRNHKKSKQRGSKSKHSRKQKHGRTKDKEGKKSKQKKKKCKHIESPSEPTEVKRSESRQSLSSSNRSRSASPLPSIHTPSPSPTELDKPQCSKSKFEKIDYDEPGTSSKHQDCEFLKDKYDKIKERRRHAARDAWESLFDYKQKVDKQKRNFHIPGKDKNQKLRETIEKLKAKNKKYKDTSLFTTLFTPRSTRQSDKKKDYKEDESDVESIDDDDDDDDEPLENVKGKCINKKLVKKSSAKNESASEALEEAVKDISKWLDDAPKTSAMSSPCDSPAPTVSAEELDSCSRQDDDLSQGEKTISNKKENIRKRPSSREPKLIKRREVQRTIDRLQPGKSKGNLITNVTNKTSEKTEDTNPVGQMNKSGDLSKNEEASPKLSLGSVLPTVKFALGEEHNFVDEEVAKDPKSTDKPDEKVTAATNTECTDDKKVEQKEVVCNKRDVEVETDPILLMKPSQEKATPNLSAWFKAFGAPKTTTPTTSGKKKSDEVDNEDKPAKNNIKTKISSPKVTSKFDSPNDPNSPNPDGGESPHPSVSLTPRQRRTSTGSSVSERSSFSQDLDSPRHQMSLTSPLLRSPASPRNDDFQKISYPIINGSVRAGFYQDTTSLKSSPDKSCSPREGPQSPYSPYNQHVYAASSNIPGSATPNYFVDQNKSPLPSYSQSAPFYDATKISPVSKPRHQDEYTNVAPEMYPQGQLVSSYSPSPTQYSPVQTHYSQPQISPQPIATNSPQIPTSPQTQESKYPVKKRSYNEQELSLTPEKPQTKETIPVEPKNDYPKLTQTGNSISTVSVDEIALALSEKSQIAKMNNLRDNRHGDFDRAIYDNRKSVPYENNEPAHANKRDTINIEINKPLEMTKKDMNVDMVNMGYYNSEDKRSSTETRETEYMNRESKSIITNQSQKGYEIEAIAMNLGINNQQFPKPLTKSNVTACNMTPAHSHERTHQDISVNQNIAHAHQNQYDSLTSQTISNFSLSDIEIANKKLYTNTTPPTALDYGNWKNTNQLRKQDLISTDYSTYNAEDKSKADASASTALNYKNLQHQQYNNYASMQRINTQRTQDIPSQNIPSELRIPNPRGMHKSDNATVTPLMNDTDAIVKNIEAMVKCQKSDKHSQNHPLVSTISSYKTPYSTHSSLPIDSLRNLQSIPQMLERYSTDERYLSSFASSSLYHDKTYQMAQMFNKALVSEVATSSTPSNIYSQASVPMSKDNNVYKNNSSTTNTQADTKAKTKRKRTVDTKQSHVSTPTAYQHSTPTCNNDLLNSVKGSIMPTSAFNFGTSANMSLSGMYGDNGAFSIDDFRNSTSQLMAANYMAAAVAHQQQRNETNSDKLVKPAHQNANHSASAFPFIAHSQVRAGYPFVGAEASSQMYQQYLRYQEELQRQTGAQIMGLYPPTYPPPLGVRQPYDSINRPSWI